MRSLVIFNRKSKFLPLQRVPPERGGSRERDALPAGRAAFHLRPHRALRHPIWHPRAIRRPIRVRLQLARQPLPQLLARVRRPTDNPLSHTYIWDFKLAFRSAKLRCVMKLLMSRYMSFFRRIQTQKDIAIWPEISWKKKRFIQPVTEKIGDINERGWTYKYLKSQASLLIFIFCVSGLHFSGTLPYYTRAYRLSWTACQTFW